MKDAQTQAFQSFHEILEEHLESNSQPLSGQNPTKTKDWENPFTEGADLGLGLLSELFYLLRRSNRLPSPRLKKPQPSEGHLPPHTGISIKKPNPAEKEALDFFITEGMKHLTADSTLQEFKSAFRKLALRLHPDAHPNATVLEKTIWGHKFRKLKDLYPRLVELARRSP